jgi:2-keto-4-pentenoate hydratase/2-oxohepta-3-ene-1,7-dioic acid hydratase in catechol pathway
MRLLTYRTKEGNRCGVRRGESIIDLQRALEISGIRVPPGIREFLSLENWRELAERALEHHPESATLPYEREHLGPIVPNPQKIIFVGGNTHSHLKEAALFTKAAPPLRPMLTSKTPNTVNGPYDPIVQPEGTFKMDYEAELCVVIGTRARKVPEARVKEIIAGYSVANDVSDREYQLSQWEENSFYRTHYVGKSFDGFCPCGPELVTPDEIKNFGATRVTCSVNGVIKQDGPLSDMYFSVEQVISFLSLGITLEPGDMILMGSPAGVACFEDPPGWAKPGDVVRCEVQDIGYIENKIVKDEAKPFGEKR